jgi:hypothetical protein
LLLLQWEDMKDVIYYDFCCCCCSSCIRFKLMCVCVCVCILPSSSLFNIYWRKSHEMFIFLISFCIFFFLSIIIVALL